MWSIAIITFGVNYISYFGLQNKHIKRALCVMYATLTSTFSNDYFLCVRPNLCAFGAFLHCAFLHCGSPFGLSLTVVLPLDFLSLWFSLWTFLHCGSSSVLSSHCGSSSVLSFTVVLLLWISLSVVFSRCTCSK